MINDTKWWCLEQLPDKDTEDEEDEDDCEDGEEEDEQAPIATNILKYPQIPPNHLNKKITKNL